MSKGWRIIDIDESVIRSTDPRKRGWMIKGIENQVTTSTRLSGVNIICGVSNRNEMFYTVNRGKTNSSTFSFFLTKLCDYLDGED